ncbi:hypothetical protein HY792_05300, partial [Candidatus Desantisbacteria bacterium]|nr:hypothetical protein [Candidatus Desantisbacteria bacterium]
IMVSPTSGPVGILVTVQGVGFDNDGSITIHFGNTYTITTASPSPSGTFSITFRVDTQPSGSTQITASSPNQLNIYKDYSGQTTIFRIQGSYITLLVPSQGSVSTLVTIAGTGFHSGTTVCISFGTNQTITTTTSSSNGTFSATFRIDTQFSGTKGITAMTTKVGEAAEESYATFEITGAYIILVSPISGAVGKEFVTVMGVGFDGSQTVRIDFGTHQTITSVLSTPSGTFSTSFRVSTQPYGTTQITASTTREKNITKNENGVITTFFITGAWITVVNPTFGVVGSIVTLQGIGFKATETIKIDFGTHYTITTTTASLSGTFSTTFRVNSQSFNTKIITATGLGSDQSCTTEFAIRGDITLLTPISGYIGVIIIIEGRGVGSGSTVSIDFGTHQTITTTTASTNGTFSTTFQIDTQSATTKVITARDGNEGNSLTTSFQILSKLIEFYPRSGTVGTTITLIGNGYGSGSVMQIDFGTSQTITTTTSTENGTFSVTFCVNTQPYSSKTITVTDLSLYISGQSYYRDTTTFVILSKIISLNPPDGSVSTLVTITGTGFGTGTVRIDFGTHQTITTTAGNNNGTFSLTFRVNTQSWGTKVITVSTSSDVLNTTIFTITGAYIIMVSPTSGPVGILVTVQGVGFDNDGSITIHFGNTYTITTASPS